MQRIANLVLGIAAAAIAVAPIAIVIATNAPFFSNAHEFVAYRIGHALALAAGEGEYVQPIQGIPNAILSQWIVAILPDPASFDGFQIYGIVFFVIVAAVIAIALVYVWMSQHYNLTERLAVTVFTLTPWYAGALSVQLLLSPDYWPAEYLWLLCSLLILFRRPMPDLRSMLLLGAWIGFGLSIKMSLLGVGIVLFAASRAPRYPELTAGVATAVVAYLCVLVVYLGVNADTAFWHQVGFFISPSRIGNYASFMEAFAARPSGIVIASLAGLAAIFADGRRLKIAAGIAVALNLYLVIRRPHDTSITSAEMAFAFIALGVGRLAVSAPVLIAATALFSGIQSTAQTLRSMAVHEPSSNLEAARALSRVRGIWLVWTNEWNATLLLQALGLNGELVARPPGRKGAFVSLFPGSDMAQIEFGSPEIDRVVRLAMSGERLIWTEPAHGGSAESARLSQYLRRKLSDAGLRISEQPFSFSRRDWIFCVASLPS